MVAAIGMIVPDLFGRFGGYLSPSMDLYHGLTGWDGEMFFSYRWAVHRHDGMLCFLGEQSCFFVSISHMFCVCVCVFFCGCVVRIHIYIYIYL